MSNQTADPAQTDPLPIEPLPTDRTQTVRRRILDATYALVEERGMADVSMTAIADKAGVARQTVYNNFPDVEAAMLGYVLEELDRTATLMRHALSSLRDPEIQIRTFVTELIRRFAQQDFQVSIQAAMSPAAMTAIDDATWALRDMLLEIIDEGVEMGQFSAHMPPERMARLTFQMTVGCGHLAISGTDVDHLAEDAATLIATSVRSL